MKVLFGWRATLLSTIGIFVQKGVSGEVFAGMVIEYDSAKKSLEAG